MMDLATGRWSGENIAKLGVEKYVGEGRGLPEVRTGENRREGERRGEKGREQGRGNEGRDRGGGGGSKGEVADVARGIEGGGRREEVIDIHGMAVRV